MLELAGRVAAALAIAVFLGVSFVLGWFGIRSLKGRRNRWSDDSPWQL